MLFCITNNISGSNIIKSGNVNNNEIIGPHLNIEKDDGVLLNVYSATKSQLDKDTEDEEYYKCMYDEETVKRNLEFGIDVEELYKTYEFKFYKDIIKNAFHHKKEYDQYVGYVDYPDAVGTSESYLLFDLDCDGVKELFINNYYLYTIHNGSLVNLKLRLDDISIEYHYKNTVLESGIIEEYGSENIYAEYWKYRRLKNGKLETIETIRYDKENEKWYRIINDQKVSFSESDAKQIIENYRNDKSNFIKKEYVKAKVWATEYEKKIIKFGEEFGKTLFKIKSIRELEDDINLDSIDTIKFGHYEQDNNRDNGQEDIEWIVIDDGYSYVLLSKYIIDCKNISNSGGKWKDSSIFDWLNREFYDLAFSEVEKKFISDNYVDGLKFKVDLLSNSYDHYFYKKNKKELNNYKLATNATNYAKSINNELYIESNKDIWCCGNSPYLMKFRNYEQEKFVIVTANGMIDKDMVLDNQVLGIRPMIRVEYY